MDEDIQYRRPPQGWTRERIYEYVRNCDHSPTVREIADALELAPSGVHRHLNALHYEGRLRKHLGRIVVK